MEADSKENAEEHKNIRSIPGVCFNLSDLLSIWPPYPVISFQADPMKS